MLRHEKSVAARSERWGISCLNGKHRRYGHQQMEIQSQLDGDLWG
jgi:hypothetical protein